MAQLASAARTGRPNRPKAQSANPTPLLIPPATLAATPLVHSPPLAPPTFPSLPRLDRGRGARSRVAGVARHPPPLTGRLLASPRVAPAPVHAPPSIWSWDSVPTPPPLGVPLAGITSPRRTDPPPPGAPRASSPSPGRLRPPPQPVIVASPPPWAACLCPTAEDDVHHLADPSCSVQQSGRLQRAVVDADEQRPTVASPPPIAILHIPDE